MIIKTSIVLDHFRDATKMIYTHFTRHSAPTRHRALPSLLLLILSASCVRTEVLNEVVSMPTRTKQQDTIIVTPPADTARLPITFDPSVDDWDEKMALSMYKKAVESLKDVDRSNYIADYYHV